MSIQIVTERQDLAALRCEWNLLSSEPMTSFDWNSAWWEAFGEEKDLLLYSLRHGDRLVGIAPFCVDSWLGQKRLRLLGSGDTCSDYARIIALPEYQQELIRAVAEDVKASRNVDVVELEGVFDVEQLGRFSQTFETAQFWRYERELDNVWILDLPDSWEEFVSQAKKSLRRKIKNAEKRLASREVVVRTTPGDMEFEPAFQSLVRLHQARFTSKGEPGVFACDRFRKFLYTATRSLIDAGQAELFTGEVDGKPVVSQLYLIGSAGPQLYQSGARTDAMKLEPGHLLFTFCVKRAIEKGYRKFDFLRGSEPYKPYWGAKPSPLNLVRHVSGHVIPTCINRGYLLLRSMKSALFGRGDLRSSTSV